MLDFNRISGQRTHRTHRTPMLHEQRWNPTPARLTERRDLIKELGQLQITPGGFLC